MKRTDILRSSLLTLLALALPGAADAAVRVWDGGGANASWGTPQNWAGDVAPVNGDSLVFPAGAARPVNTNNIAGLSLAGITLEEGGYDLGGINISLHGTLSCTHSSGPVIVSIPLLLTGATTFSTANPSTSLSIRGPVVPNGHQLTLHSVASSGITFNTLAPIAGTQGGSVVKTGPGSLSLQSAGTDTPNVFTGPFDVQEGSLNVGHPMALGTAAVGTTMASGTELILSFPAGTTSFAEPVDLGGSLTSGLFSNSDTLTLMGAWELTGASTDIRVNGPTTLLLGGALTQAVASTSLRKLGLGTLRVANGGDLVFPGGVTVAEGILELAKSSGTIDATQSVGSGAGLSGFDRLRWAASEQLSADSAVSLTASFAELELRHHLQTLASLDLSPGRFFLSVSGTVPGTSHGKFVVNGPVVVSNGMLNLTDTASFAAALGTEIMLIENDGTDAVGGTFTGLTEGAQMVVGQFICTLSYVGGTGNDVVLTVTAFNGSTRVWDGGGTTNNWTTSQNWVGDTAPGEGDALVFPAGASRLASVNNFPAGTRFQTIQIEEAGYTFTGNALLLTAGVTCTQASGFSALNLPVTLAAPQTWTTDHGTLETNSASTLDTAGHTLTFHTPNANGATQWIMRAGISGGGGLVKTGPGRIALTAANTYTGHTDVQQGTITVQDNAALGAPSTGTTLGSAATLVLNTNTSNLAEPLLLNGCFVRPVTGTYVLSGALQLGPSTTTQLDLANGALSLTGAVSGDGGLRKTGAGTLTIGGSAANTFLGGFTSEGGLTLLQKPSGLTALRGALSLVAATNTESTELRLAAPNQIDNAATLSASGALAVFNGAGFDETLDSLVLTGASVLSGGAGTLSLRGTLTTLPAANTTLIVGRLLLTAGSPQNWNIADGIAVTDLLVNAVVGGRENSVLVKQDGGRVDFVAENTLTDFVAREGQLIFNGANPLSTVLLDGGLLGGTGSLRDVITDGTPSVVSPGTSTAALGLDTFTFDERTTLRIEANGSDPATGYDQILCQGDYDLGEAELELLLNFVPPVSSVFTIIESKGGKGSARPFRGLEQDALLAYPNGLVFRIDYKAGDGDDVTLTRIDVPAAVVGSFTVQPGTGPNAGQNEVRLNATGLPGVPYRSEWSEDLENWMAGGTRVAAPGSGALPFVLLFPPSQERVFVRVVYP